MNTQETIEALEAIGLKGELKTTGSPDWQRIFVVDAEGIAQRRISIHHGKYLHAKWYVEKIYKGPVIPDERIPWAWNLWLSRREPLPVETWDIVVKNAVDMAKSERAEKMEWRRNNPCKRDRPRLSLNVRKYIDRILLGTG